jgi:hypothetical protein
MDYREIKAKLVEKGFGVHDLPLVGKNEDGETLIISVVKDIETGSDAFKVETAQDNGWMRVNIYYKDGTVEELYER